MRIPIDLINIITDYYVSMVMYDTKQRMNAEFRKNIVIAHLKSFHETTHEDGVFSPSFCLAVLGYMKRHNMIV